MRISSIVDDLQVINGAKLREVLQKIISSDLIGEIIHVEQLVGGKLGLLLQKVRLM